MSMPASVPRYTAAEIRSFPDDRLRYEVIRGDLFVTPAPGTAHQRAVRDLCERLHRYLADTGLGEAIPAPFEVEFAADTAVQPDVIALVHANRPRLTAERLYGPPALVVEVVSYSSKRTDRLQKRRLYQEAGVAEYWVVDLDARRVERWSPGATEPDILSGELRWQPSAAVPPLVIALPPLFQNLD
jgi:Uma2 family endonuclease